jgi:hypothetical protein
MTNIQKLLKINEASIASVNALVELIIREINDSQPLKGIISDTERFTAIGEDISDYCMVAGIKENLVTIAIQTITKNRKDYIISDDDFNMLFKLRAK